MSLSLERLSRIVHADKNRADSKCKITIKQHQLMFHLSALLFFQAYKNEPYGGILCLTLCFCYKDNLLSLCNSTVKDDRRLNFCLTNVQDQFKLNFKIFLRLEACSSP